MNRLFTCVAGMCLSGTLAFGQSYTQGNTGDFNPSSRVNLGATIASEQISPEERLKLRPKYKVQKNRQHVDPENALPGVVIVKFVDGARVRALNPQDLNENATDKKTLDTRLNTLVSRQRFLDKADLAFLREKGIEKSDIAGQMRQFRDLVRDERIEGWGRLHKQPIEVLDGLRARTEKRTGRRASDMGNYYWIKVQKEVDPLRLVRRLNDLKIIEQAYLMPSTSDPDIAPPTPDYSGNQGYLNNTNNGIHARFAWTQPGGKGDFVRIIDIESGWHLSHEDLPSFSPLPNFNDEDNDHGTGVMGVMVAREDGAGVTGIVPRASAGMVTKLRRTGFGKYENLSGSILDAAVQLSAGDIILIEAQSQGPRRVDCTCETDDGGPRDQCGLIPTEWSDNVYDVIQAASNSGIIVVQAAGNGEQDLNDPIFDGKFNRAQRDSGAIIVAASRSNSRTRMCFSNHGDRVDMHAWGENVMTTGYGVTGFRANGNDRDQWYTNRFSGTSSASPIVTGAVAAIQGVQMANNNPPLNWLQMREVLRDTGTPPLPGNNIGPLPNLTNAINVLAPPTPPDAVYGPPEITLGDFVPAANVAGLSTSSSSQRREIGGGGPAQAIERIMYAERSDRPCYLRVEKANILTNEMGPRRFVDECGSRGHTDRSERYVPTWTTSHDTFIRKIAVCNSRTNNHPFRLKGIRVWRTRVNDDGSLFPLTSEITSDRTNCDDNWRTPSECPANSIAARVEVHLRADGNDLSVSGLRLICREVQVTRQCLENCP